jgi:Ca-activated chloride channel family protein
LHAPQLATQVEIDVSGVLARAKVRQRFFNPTDSWVEGVYTFPLPDNAAVDRLRMRIGSRLVEGEVQEKQQADRRYRAARASGQAASLLQQRRPNVFTIAVANIPPGQAVDIEIAYQQRLEWREGRFSLRFPSVVAPRYIPAQTPASTRCQGVGCFTGWAADTAQVPDASAITPPVATSAPDDFQRFSLHARVVTGFPLAKVRSRSHAVQVRTVAPGSFEIRLAGRSALADRDFTLEWQPVADAQPRLALFGEQWGGRHYSLLVLMPPSMDADVPRLNRELVLVIDTSGSMHGASLDQARRAVREALTELGEGDCFNLIQFNDRVHALFDRARPVNADNLVLAQRYVAGLVAEGGTEMRPAIARALRDPGQSGRLRQVVFLTDGAIGNEQALFEMIERDLGESRLFTVGIGVAPNAYFMRRAARFGRGTYTFIGHSAEVDARVGELFQALNRPVLTDLAVQWQLPPGVSPAEPAIGVLPDLYAGEPLVVSAVSDAPPRAVEISGVAGDRDWRERRAFNDASTHAGVHALWARRRIADWLDAQVSGVDPERIRQAVIRLGLAHRLVTPHTSLVAVDRTPMRPAGAALEQGVVPVRLPAGWSARHVFGQLPATATPTALLAIGGVALLLVALGLWAFPPTSWSPRVNRSRC